MSGDEGEAPEQEQPTDEMPAPPDFDTRQGPDDLWTVKQALAKVMGEVQFIGKGGEFKQEGVVKYRFRGVDAVVQAVGPMLRKHGVLVIPKALSHKSERVPISGGRTMNNVVVEMQYSLISLIDGDEPLVGSAFGEGFDSGDKATAKAMAVAYRVFWLQALAIPTDDPDPDSENYQGVSGSHDAPPAPPRGGSRNRSSSRGRQQAQQEPADPDAKVAEGQAKTLRDAIARIEPESYRATVLAEFKATFGIEKAAEMPKNRYTEAAKWIQAHSTPPDDAGSAASDPPPPPAADAAEPAEGATEGPTFTEMRTWLEGQDDPRKFVQKQLALIGKPATGRTDDLLDTLAAEWARRGGVPDEFKE